MLFDYGLTLVTFRFPRIELLSVLEDHEGPRRLGMRAVLCTALARRPPGDGVPTVARLADLVALVERAA